MVPKSSGPLLAGLPLKFSDIEMMSAKFQNNNFNIKLQKLFVALDEVERKLNLDLWLFRVGLPVHGSRLKNTTFL